MGRLSECHIFIVDDQPDVCAAMSDVLKEAGGIVTSFTLPAECLDLLGHQRCDLLVTDLRMPGMDGIELLKRAKSLLPWLPVLIVTGYGDVPTAVEAIKTGAINFIEKPLNKKSFVNMVKSILREKARCISPRQPLTPSERKVLDLIIDGKTNREIADLLKRSRRTIEIHRSRVMHKLGAKTLVDLVKRATAMGLADWSGDGKPERTEQNRRANLNSQHPPVVDKN